MSPRKTQTPEKPSSPEVQWQRRADNALTRYTERLEKVLNDPKASVMDLTRAGAELGRIRQYAWHLKPESPEPAGEGISESTAKILLALADKHLGNCPNCGAKL